MDEDQTLVFREPEPSLNPPTTLSGSAQTSKQGGEMKLTPKITQALPASLEPHIIICEMGQLS